MSVSSSLRAKRAEIGEFSTASAQDRLDRAPFGCAQPEFCSASALAVLSRRLLPAEHLPVARTRAAMKRLFNDFRSPFRAVGAYDSISEVPGGGLPCHHALRITSRGERPGLRGPDAPSCEHLLRLAPDDSVSEVPGGGHLHYHHAVPHTRRGSVRGGPEDRMLPAAKPRPSSALEGRFVALGLCSPSTQPGRTAGSWDATSP